MKKSVKYSKELKEFETVGFVKSRSDLLQRLRVYYGRYLKIFCPAKRRSLGRNYAKYGSYELFGDKICYYYDVRREDEFINFLVNKFLEENPEPDSNIRKVFTGLLHNYGLCWFGCRHEVKKELRSLFDHFHIIYAKIQKGE